MAEARAVLSHLLLRLHANSLLSCPISCHPLHQAQHFSTLLLRENIPWTSWDRFYSHTGGIREAKSRMKIIPTGRMRKLTILLKWYLQ